ncbi:18232_t:CDS:2, partial [Gigaspora rosea]
GFLLSANIYSGLEGDKENDNLILAAIAALSISGQVSYVLSYIEGGNNDITGSIVITWTLIGIFVEQQDSIVHWISLVLAIVSIFHIVKGICDLYRRSRSNSEHAPMNP